MENLNCDLDLDLEWILLVRHSRAIDFKNRHSRIKFRIFSRRLENLDFVLILEQVWALGQGFGRSGRGQAPPLRLDCKNSCSTVGANLCVRPCKKAFFNNALGFSSYPCSRNVVIWFDSQVIAKNKAERL